MGEREAREKPRKVGETLADAHTQTRDRTVPLLARISISSEASPRPLGAPYARMHPRRTTSAAARTAPFHPPANRDSFKDLLVFEERLKQNAQRYARTLDL